MLNIVELHVFFLDSSDPCEFPARSITQKEARHPKITPWRNVGFRGSCSGSFQGTSNSRNLHPSCDSAQFRGRIPIRQVKKCCWSGPRQELSTLTTMVDG